MLYFFLFLISFNIFSWDQNKYSEWLENVGADITINENSPYFGLHSDCADAALLYKAIFSYENKLSFSYTNVKGERIVVEKFKNLEHFRGFVKKMFNESNSYTISRYDTYPIALDKILPGDLFHYEIIKNNKKIKHIFIIKSIDDYGMFTFLYSSQSIRRSNILKKYKKFKIRENQEVRYLPRGRSKGFLRFNNNLKNDFSKEQYTYKDVNKINQKIKSIYSIKKINKKIIEKRICKKLKDRIELVNSNLKKESCYSFKEYDSFSSVIMDRELYEDMSSLGFKVSCVEFTKDYSLEKILLNFKNKKISSDPHQKTSARWGFEKQKKHSCEIFY